MADKVNIGTIRTFDAKNRRGVIVPAEIAEVQTGLAPIYFEGDAPQGSSFRVGQLVQYVVDADSDSDSDRQAKDVAVLTAE